MRRLYIGKGGKLDVVPGIYEIVIGEGAEFGRFSNGTVEIYDMRYEAVGREAFEGVETVREFTGSGSNRKPIWLPPTLVSASVYNADKQSLAACTELRKLFTGPLSEHDVLPPRLTHLTIGWYEDCVTVPAHLERLEICDGADDDPRPPRGDFSNLNSLDVYFDIWKGMVNAGTQFPALRDLHLYVHEETDITGHVFPDGIVELELCGFVGAPIFPSKLEKLRIRSCNLTGIPGGVSVIAG